MKKILLSFALTLLFVSMTACSDQSAEAPADTETEPVAVVSESKTEAVSQTDAPASTETAIIVTEPETEPKAEAPENDISPETEAAAESDSSWKELYIRQLNALDIENYEGFYLLDINGDRIPELYAAGKSHMLPSELYWVYDDQLYSYSISYNGLSYLEGENLFLNSGGFTGYGSEQVLSIYGDSVDVIANGEFSIVTGKEYYRWNGVDVTKAEYDSEKSASFPLNRAVTPSVSYSYSDVCYQIENW